MHIYCMYNTVEYNVLYRVKSIIHTYVDASSDDNSDSPFPQAFGLIEQAGRKENV